MVILRTKKALCSAERTSWRKLHVIKFSVHPKFLRGGNMRKRLFSFPRDTCPRGFSSRAPAAAAARSLPGAQSGLIGDACWALLPSSVSSSSFGVVPAERSRGTLPLQADWERLCSVVTEIATDCPAHYCRDTSTAATLDRIFIRVPSHFLLDIEVVAEVDKPFPCETIREKLVEMLNDVMFQCSWSFGRTYRFHERV